jgi:hypothetical protein
MIIAENLTATIEKVSINPIFKAKGKFHSEFRQD